MTRTGLGHAIGRGPGRTHGRAASGGGAVEESWSGGGIGEESWSGGGSSAGLVAKMVWVKGSGTRKHRVRAGHKGWGRAKGRD